MEEKIKTKKWMLKSLYSNQIKPSFLSKSVVENTLIPYFSSTFNLTSLDQTPTSYSLPLNANAKAAYGTSFLCSDNIFSAFGIESLKKFFLTGFINKGKEESITSKSLLSILNLEQISFLCLPTSFNISLGENNFKLYFNKGSKINSFGVESFLKKEKAILASTTSLILTDYLISPYLLANDVFTSLPSLKQSLSDNLLSFVIRLNTESNNFLNSLDLSNLASDSFSSIASKANLDSSSGNSLISCSNLSGISTFNSAILTSNAKEDIELYKSFGLTSAEIRSEYLKHSLVINENNYLTYYAGNLTLNTSIDPGKWYHVSSTYNDNGEANLFLDGVNVESSSDGPKLKSNLYKAWIGSWSGLTNEFNGTIDNVVIYSRALTNQTIKAHFERGIKTYSLKRLRTTSTKEQWNKTVFTNLRIVS